MLAALDTARADFSRAHHSCLGLESGPAYSGPGAKAGMRNDDARMEARRYSLLDYLQQHGWRMLWRGGRPGSGGTLSPASGNAALLLCQSP